MTNGRGRAEWNQTAALLCCIMSIMHDPKSGRLPSVSDLNPFIPKKPIPKVPLTVLRDLWVKEKK